MSKDGGREKIDRVQALGQIALDVAPVGINAAIHARLLQGRLARIDLLMQGPLACHHTVANAVRRFEYAGDFQVMNADGVPENAVWI